MILAVMQMYTYMHISLHYVFPLHYERIKVLQELGG